jgi:hypothetical protein
MILTVIHDQQSDLSIAAIAATAIYGAGLTQGFPDPVHPGKLVAYQETGAAGGGIQVQCAVADGPFVRAGFVAVKFQTIEPVEPLPPNRPTNVKSHIVTPAVPDNQYPSGAEATGRVAATALCGAWVTQPSPNGDPYDGDPASSMQVSCCDTDQVRAAQGFGAVAFKFQ